MVETIVTIATIAPLLLQITFYGINYSYHSNHSSTAFTDYLLWYKLQLPQQLQPHCFYRLPFMVETIVTIATIAPLLLQITFYGIHYSYHSNHSSTAFTDYLLWYKLQLPQQPQLHCFYRLPFMVETIVTIATIAPLLLQITFYGINYSYHSNHSSTVYIDYLLWQKLQLPQQPQLHCFYRLPFMVETIITIATIAPLLLQITFYGRNYSYHSNHCSTAFTDYLLWY